MSNLVVNRWQQVLLYAFTAVILLLAFANVLSPLRLNTDGIRYFNILLYQKGLLPANDYAGRDYLPHGYPSLLKILDSLHLLSGKTIVIVNLFGLLITAYFLCRLFKLKQTGVFWVMLLLSFINIKHFTLPLADELFTGCLFACIYYWSEAVTNSKWHNYFIAVVLTIISISLRTAGIVIIAGLLLYVINVFLDKRLARYKFWLIGALIIIMAGCFVWKADALEKKNDYFRQLEVAQLVQHPLSVTGRLGTHFKELGEFVFNIPSSKINSLLHLSNEHISEVVLVTIGLLVFAIIIYAGIKAGLFRGIAGYIYVCYLLMIFVWPFYDTRFLIPAVPFFVYSLYMLIINIRWHWVAKVLIGLYVVMGMISLAYSDVISLNRKIFLQSYTSDKELSDAYKAHFTRQSVQPDINGQRVLYLLNTYDK